MAKNEITKDTKTEKSILQNLSTLTVYDKFKVVTTLRKVKIKDALEEAVVDYINKYMGET